MKKEIRTRFAPSPTGHLHIGNGRTALMNWLFARHSGGKFILRIEDTDRERSTETSEISILEDLKWLGLDWDEGPDRQGQYGPYRQSERMGIYREYIEKLNDAGKAYPCFCTPEELENRRLQMLAKGQSPKYDGRCRELDKTERERLMQAGIKSSIRFRVDQDEADFKDLIRGHLSFSKETLGDFVLLRPDNTPVYNFACVVDDHTMDITHIIRGDDHISNTPRQFLLYQAFGWTTPLFAHIPMILGKDRERLSKRHGATSVSQYRELGYLPEALVNFLSLLGWSSESGEEILSRKRLIDEFDFNRVSKAPSVFDVEKLKWMNGVYIRNLDVDTLTDLLDPFLKREDFSSKAIDKIKPIVALLQDKLENLSAIQEKIKIFTRDQVIFESVEAKTMVRSSGTRPIMKAFLHEMSPNQKWDTETFARIMKRVQDQTGVKGKQVWMPVRIALTGQMHGPDLSKVAEILGYEKCQRFIRNILNG
ncbi:glutamate--tRNA ligase [bacterium]|nr:glutamate--tRNA ligase [bacterium]RQV94363.1 MAG: glutamate--tRNA ligase [bacterium]